MNTLLTYDDAFAAGPQVAGGKGWNLGRLARYGFPVPAGRVLSTAVYRELLADPTIAQLASELAEVTAEETMSALVVERLATLRDELLAARLPEGVVAELQAFLKEREGTAWAVRSSAAAEDGAEASFAGIHESFLNVTGLADIVAAIRETYASLWTPHALAYRRRLRIGDSQCLCAAVICQMIAQADGQPPVAAGVAFSCDPSTGQRDVVVINAARGLGDAVVRGTTQPEQVTIKASYGDWSIAKRSPQPAGVQSALGDAELQRLARLVYRVHWTLGDGQDPQDVEWAYDGQQFWIVQARPVTRLPRWTFPAVANQPVHWSNANVRDSMPEPITMYTWCAVHDIVGHILYAAPRELKYPVPDGMECMRRFSGRAYFDLTGTQWLMYDAMGILPADIKKDMGGAQPEIEVPSQQPLQGPEGKRRAKAQRSLLWRLWNFQRELLPAIEKVQTTLQAARRHDLSSDSRQQLKERVDTLYAGNLEFATLFQLANTNAGIWQMMASGFLKWLDKEHGATLSTRLLTGGGDVPSAEQGYRLIDLANIAREDMDARRMLEAGDQDPQAWRSLPLDSPFRAAFEQYLHDYGHRAAVEAEFANPRWIDDPTYLLEQVRFHLGSEPTADPRARAHAARLSAEADLKRTTWLWRPLARLLVGKAQRGFALREHAKSALLATAEPLRRIVVEIAERLQKAGQLDQIDDIFHLTPYDLECYLRDEWQGQGIRALACDRRAQLALWKAESPPDVITCAPDHRAGAVQYAATSVAAEPGDTWHGVAAASGVASGRAVVLRSPHAGAELRRGDVLVAPSTDPGWTPLFLRASAIVMETGGFLSHGAIVAREYGLPAVVNLPGILAQVHSGDTLLVDGNAGLVRRTSDPVSSKVAPRESARLLARSREMQSA